MALTRGFIRNAATTPLDARLMDMAELTVNADGSPRPGVLDTYGAALVTALATMNVAIAAADFVTSKGTADGVAIFTNDGTVNVAITAAPASNSRIDVIWVRHQDSTTGDGASTPIFGVTAGVAAASPTKPAIPTGALELATLRVYAGTTAANGGANTLTNTYPMTSLRGAPVCFRTKADLDLWTNPGTPGQLAEVVSNGARNALYRWSGTAWRRIAPTIGAVMKRATDFALTNGVYVAVPFDTTDINDGAMWASGNPTRFTAPIAGIYRFSGAVNQVNSTGNGDIQPRINGTTVLATFTVPNSAGAALITWSVEVWLNAGEYLEVLARTSGGNFPWIAGNRVAASLVLAA